jgi:hypothetical protein
MAATNTTPAKPPTRRVRQMTQWEKRRIAQRNRLWPAAGNLVWNRKHEDGFTTIPRTLPLVCALIRHLTDDLDASRAYLDLWGRTLFDTGMVEVNDAEELAASCGYATARNERTWRERIRALVDLGFVKVAPKGTREYGFVLVLHPHDVVHQLRKAKKVPDWWWSLFEGRLAEIGAELRGTDAA